VPPSGAQDVFLSLLDLLHSPEASVSMAVFSLNDLSSDKLRPQCLARLRTQLDSFAVHASGSPLVRRNVAPTAAACSRAPRLSASSRRLGARGHPSRTIGTAAGRHAQGLRRCGRPGPAGRDGGGGDQEQPRLPERRLHAKTRAQTPRTSSPARPVLRLSCSHAYASPGVGRTDNDEEGALFFAVENTKGYAGDETIKNLVGVIERTAVR
jgi:hypothetical protein